MYQNNLQHQCTQYFYVTLYMDKINQDILYQRTMYQNQFKTPCTRYFCVTLCMVQINQDMLYQRKILGIFNIQQEKLGTFYLKYFMIKVLKNLIGCKTSVRSQRYVNTYHLSSVCLQFTWFSCLQKVETILEHSLG